MTKPEATLGIDDELEALRAWGVFVREVRAYFALTTEQGRATETAYAD